MNDFSRSSIPSARGVSKASVGKYAYLDDFTKPLKSVQKALSTDEGRSRVRTLLERGTSAPIEKKFRITDIEKKFQQYGYTIINRLFTESSVYPTHYILSTRYGDEFILETDQADPLYEGAIILSKEYPILHECKNNDSTYAATETLCASNAYEDIEKKVTVSKILKVEDSQIVFFQEDKRGFAYLVVKEADMFPHVGDVIDITQKVALKMDEILDKLNNQLVKIIDDIIVPETNKFVEHLYLLQNNIDLGDYISSDVKNLVDRVKALVEKQKKVLRVGGTRKYLRHKGNINKMKDYTLSESANRYSINNAIQEFYNLSLDELIKDMSSGKEFTFVCPDIQGFLNNTKDL